MRKPSKPMTAYEKAIDYLSRRDHSEFELKTKLSQKGYEEDEILPTLEKIKAKGYLQNSNELAEKVAEELHRKLKGILFIQAYLESKKLPVITPDWEIELEKAQKLVHKQLKRKDAKESIFRYLANRGFAEETIREVVKSESI